MPELSARTLLDPSVLADPYPFYAALRRTAPVWPVPGVAAAVVSTWDLVTEAVGRTADFSNHLDRLLVTGADGRPTLFPMAERGSAIRTLATADPPEHTAHRRVVFPELVEARMAAMEPEVRALANPLVTAAVLAGRVELMRAVSNPLPMLVLARVLGLPGEDLAQLVEWAFLGTELLAGTVTGPRMAELGAAATAAAGYLAARLADAVDRPATTLLLGTVAAAVKADALPFEEAVATLVILLGAGGESTTSLIGSAVRMLAADPGQQQRLRSEPVLIPAFVEEVLRLECPFRFHYRTVARDTELGGVELRAGSTLLLSWASANRDGAEFERPDEVLLNRAPPRHHLGFGRGIHHCVGAPLARLETRVVLELLLAATGSFTLNPARPPAYVESLFVRRPAHLHLVFG